MCLQLENPWVSRLKNSMYEHARRFYITRPWGMNIDPITLSSLFERMEGTRIPSKSIGIGSKVSLLDLQEKQLNTIKIVEPQHSRPHAGDISFLSPLGSALMEARVDDVISIPVLGYMMKFQVVRVD